MEFKYKYSGNTSIKHSTSSTSLSFAPDMKREPTFFRGKLNSKIPFREAISALHHIVVSDYRYKGKDRTAYLEWAEKQRDIWLAEAMATGAKIKEELSIKHKELQALHQKSNRILAPYYEARNKYFKHLYTRDYDAWVVLDPVITVHPDEIFFECFSKDESSFGKLSCDFNVFDKISDLAYGTTNIDYSVKLYNEFQKIRTYKETDFVIDPSGFEVQTGNEGNHKEVKIDLPDSWVRGFLQVSSAMTLPTSSFTIDPQDMANFLFFLKRHREKHGPRSIRWKLCPGKPIRISFDPWDKEIICKRSIYTGSGEHEVRMWGRRRLNLLERLLPVTNEIKVTLLGTGMPSFFEMKMDDMVFTLGLSGWTANDWSRSGNFDLMTPRIETDGVTQQKIYIELKKHWFANAQEISTHCGEPISIVESVLGNLIQDGKVVYDMHRSVYRIRDLANKELPIDQLRYRNEREAIASKILADGGLKYDDFLMKENSIVHRGKVNDKLTYDVMVEINDDERIVTGSCTCNYFRQNKLYKGPCEHIIALRKVATNRIT